MEFIRDLHNLHASHKGCVVTIGNFDGVHLGHQAIIRQLQAASTENHQPAGVVIFEPHPQEFLHPDRAPARLMRLREKLIYLRQSEIDRVVCLRFNRALSSLPAEDFIRNVLVNKLGVRHLIVGEDFRFGNKRKGDISTLTQSGKTYGFTLECTESCKIDGRRVSSSWAREVLEAGDMIQAEKLLGRPYAINGRVVHGDKRGRVLGYPTININLHRNQSPVAGIFAANVYGLEPEVIHAAVSVGTRPVFDGRYINLEAHLLDFDQEVYGAYVTVELLKQLRHEQMFGNIDDLKVQMDRDIAEIRKFFKNDNNRKGCKI
jgi:riboflavin kinase/FMN adenylyltransferase